MDLHKKVGFAEISPLCTIESSWKVVKTSHTRLALANLRFWLAFFLFRRMGQEIESFVHQKTEGSKVEVYTMIVT